MFVNKVCYTLKTSSTSFPRIIQSNTSRMWSHWHLFAPKPNFPIAGILTKLLMEIPFQAFRYSSLRISHLETSLFSIMCFPIRNLGTVHFFMLFSQSAFGCLFQLLFIPKLNTVKQTQVSLNNPSASSTCGIMGLEPWQKPPRIPTTIRIFEHHERFWNLGH